MSPFSKVSKSQHDFERTFLFSPLNWNLIESSCEAEMIPMNVKTRTNSFSILWIYPINVIMSIVLVELTGEDYLN